MERDTYHRGDCHISVTQLIDAPRIKILKEKYADRLVVDVADSLWSLVGKALHHIAEGGADDSHLAEERLFADVLGWRLSGGIDLQKHGGNSVGVRDYKFTSVWAALANKPEWERQLNIYSWLAHVNKGWITQDLEITALLRDWSRIDAKRDRNYPQAPIMVVPITLWSVEEQRAYVEERIRLHQDTWRREEWEEELPHCTDAEMWAKPTRWALVKRGAGRASAVFDTKAEAEGWLSGREIVLYDVIERPGERTRCSAFCSVSDYCDQHQTWKKKYGRETAEII